MGNISLIINTKNMRLWLKKGKVTEAMKDIIYHMTINGFSSPIIANELWICAQTIVFHRKNMNIDWDNGLWDIY